MSDDDDDTFLWAGQTMIFLRKRQKSRAQNAAL